MPTISDSDILDLLNTTHYDESKGEFTFLAPGETDYVAFELMKANKIVKSLQGGKGVMHQIVSSDGVAAQWKGMWDKDDITVKDVIDQIEVKWKFLSRGCSYVREELMQNTGKYRINNLFKPRILNAKMAMINAFENAFWELPDSAQDKPMYGLFYWLVPNATQGYYGGLPTYTNTKGNTFTDVGGVNISQVDNFKNYTDTYSAVTQDDLIDTMLLARTRTGWRSPISSPEFKSTTGLRRIIFTNVEVDQKLNRLLRNQNENLGSDLAMLDGEAVFKRHPIMAVPHLDEYTNAHTDMASPIVMMDMDSFRVCTDPRTYFTKSDAIRNAENHNQFDVFYDFKAQTICYNRRANAVITYSA